MLLSDYIIKQRKTSSVQTQCICTDTDLHATGVQPDWPCSNSAINDLSEILLKISMHVCSSAVGDS